MAAYAHPDRGYHDTRHLAEVCARLDELRDAGTAYDRTAVLLAAWFHDAVYDGERDAEERSAAWAEADLPPLGLSRELVAEVARLVRVTEAHHPEDDDPDGHALSDADLAILAAPQERYDEYVATVRTEYAHVPDPDFATGRAAVLRSLLAKPHLFHTPHARTHWESPARANVEAELTRLIP
ncbi:hypothetical protein H5V45_15190 [Nocardioides sp. KIGAM211]|uniref:Metal-dependent phosphohydrolase n=1 Tax=Nocardioides luti TaxID=2761101 RepID=A0A7X0RKB3_9ACTN|nr:hypothetical protein [Nocardioides luti]MBB6628669.1 hypothetical protein [Nocardioides luti]